MINLEDYPTRGKVPHEHGDITLRDYQWLGANLGVDLGASNMTKYRRYLKELIESRDADSIKEAVMIARKKFDPERAFLEFTTGAGKTFIMAATASYLSNCDQNTLIITRRTDLVRQDHEACWEVGAHASKFCASLRGSGTAHRIVVGSEGTLTGTKKKKDGVVYTLKERFSIEEMNNVDPTGGHKDGWVPNFILIDECDEVDSVDAAKCIKAAREGFDIYTNLDEDGKPKFSQYAVLLAHFQMVNPSVTVVGYTGTPFRGEESIIGPFWNKQIGPAIDMEYLVDRGMLVRTQFGDTGNGYDFGDFSDQVKQDGNIDFNQSQLDEMHGSVPRTLTDEIMREVIVNTINRNGVLVTCANIKHCEEAAFEVELHYARQLRARILKAGHVPCDEFESMHSEQLKSIAKPLGVDISGGWCSITSKTKNRDELLLKVQSGEIKYTFQVGCLNVGVDVPLWDTSVFLRPIMSLRVLIQLIGRGVRLPKDYQIEAGIVKTDHRVYDYSRTMEVMMGKYENRMLERCQLDKDKRSGGDLKRCPRCRTENSPGAKRCIHTDSNGERCEHFWSSKLCPNPSCGAENSHGVMQCRKCGGDMMDPNSRLDNKHYKEGDEIPVLDLKCGITAGGMVWVNLFYDDVLPDGSQRIAKLKFFPFSKEPKKQAHCRRIFYNEFAKKFFNDRISLSKLNRAKDAQSIAGELSKIRKPVKATHRVSKAGKHVVARMYFEE